MGNDLLDGDVELTEFVELDVQSVKGVKTGANGFPPLLMKGLAPAAKAGGAHPPFTGTHSHPHPAMGSQDGDETHEHSHSHDGDADHGHSHAEKSEFDREAAKELVKAIVGRKVDETPDIAGGTAVLAQIADLIIAEAQELKAGQAGEISDIQQLACAAEMIWCWRTGEEAAGSGSVMPATALMQSAFEYPADDVAKDSREFSAAERKKHAAEGNALPDGSYPIPDKDALRRAAILARSGHGDVAAAKRLIARRARELGVKNPLDDDKDDASKSAVAEGDGAVDTETQGTGGQIAKAVADAVTKAVAPLQERIESLSGELAKVKATPLPGGPVLSGNVQVRRPDGVQDTGLAAKAALYRQKAADATSPADREGYLALARETDEQARKAVPAS